MFNTQDQNIMKKKNIMITIIHLYIEKQQTTNIIKKSIHFKVFILCTIKNNQKSERCTGTTFEIRTTKT